MAATRPAGGSYGACPDNAVIKLGACGCCETGHDDCKGRGICAAECPRGAIALQAEPA